MLDSVSRLFQSTIALYERFNLPLIPAFEDLETMLSARRKFLREETGEMCDASAILETWNIHVGQFVPDSPSLGNLRHEIALEAADVLVTTIGLLLAHGITQDEFDAACAAVALKNDQKTLETHSVVDRKITRRK